MCDDASVVMTLGQPCCHDQGQQSLYYETPDAQIGAILLSAANHSKLAGHSKQACTRKRQQKVQGLLCCQQLPVPTYGVIERHLQIIRHLHTLQHLLPNCHLPVEVMFVIVTVRAML
jgi:hypothetical protein